MIISHTHKFIFLKSCKTAGTSIEVFLSAYVGPGDIVTKIGEETAPWHKKKNVDGYYNHISAAEVRSRCKQWNEYYKFTAVRHPLDRMLSLYHWQSSTEDFNKWIKHGMNQGKASSLDLFYRIKGEKVLDDYIYYEQLESDLQRICEIIGLEYDSKYLLHYKKRKRKDIEITDNTKNLIREKFAHEFKDFGYEI